MSAFTIEANASLSDAVDIGCTAHGQRIVAIAMPSAWTPADLTLQASHDDGTTYNDVYDDDDAEVVIQAGASRYIVLDRDMASRLTNLRFIKLRSGTSGSAVIQAAARTIEVVTG